ncbi:Uncharacterized protein Fot_31661 [Forsythia ovata]|uniref:Uncharacterized protein n=1 Tax=Forsythia ovata TaxID=205694 RepID=A0ABD1T5M8_9LAMI
MHMDVEEAVVEGGEGGAEVGTEVDMKIIEQLLTTYMRLLTYLPSLMTVAPLPTDNTYQACVFNDKRRCAANPSRFLRLTRNVKAKLYSTLPFGTLPVATSSSMHWRQFGTSS